jgi:hypothetical protein
MMISGDQRITVGKRRLWEPRTRRGRGGKRMREGYEINGGWDKKEEKRRWKRRKDKRRLSFSGGGLKGKYEWRG